MGTLMNKRAEFPEEPGRGERAIRTKEPEGSSEL